MVSPLEWINVPYSNPKEDFPFLDGDNLYIRRSVDNVPLKRKEYERTDCAIYIGIMEQVAGELVFHNMNDELVDKEEWPYDFYFGDLYVQR